MKKIRLTIVCFSFLSISISAQRQASKEIIVTGKVIDLETKQPLEYATISFFNAKKNKVITGGITDIKGHFSIPISSGIYDVFIEYISFKKQTLLDKQLFKNENLGTISLVIDTESLDEVEIIAERTTVEIKLDKRIYNVGKDLTIRGGTVSDVLDNVPSVSVDVEGNVSLRGNNNVRILINGKPSGLVGLNSTDALRQLPAESIAKVEVITSPSARYDAEGTAGIINIILRRSKLQGLNGAITTNVGYNPSAGVSGNINYRTGDFNIFNTTGYSYRDIPGNSLTETSFFDGPFIREEREFYRIRKGINTNFGVEWYINDSASLTTSILYRNSDNETETTNNLSGTNFQGNSGNTIRIDNELEDDKTIQYSLNFDKQFNEDSQHKLTFDFQFETSTEDERSKILQNNEDSERVNTLDNRDRILLQTDYVKPIGKNGQFEVGYRGNFIDQKTDYNVAFNENGNFINQTNLSNTLLYKENINAIYTQYGNKIGEKFSYLLGLRMEATRITINQITSNDFDRKTYSNLFPTINLGYEISENQSFTLGYNRRLRRPFSFFINPFPSRSSATNLFQGNPDLDPTFSNKIDLGYLNKFGKLTFNSSLYYQHTTDVFTFVSLPTEFTAIINGEEIPVIKRTPINLATNDRYGFEFTLVYKPSRKFNINGNFNIFQFETKGDFDGVNYDAKNVSWFARLNTKYTLPAKIDWQTRLSYRGPSEDAQNKREGIFSANVAFSKDLFKDKASIAFNVSDVFNTRKRKRESFTDTFNGFNEFQFRERTFNLSFTYRFNQKKKRSRGNRQGGGGFEFEGQP